MAENPVREGFRTVTPYLPVQGATRLVEFLKAAFGAEQTFQSASGTHFEVRIGGDSMVMLSDVSGAGRGPAMPASLFVYVRDADRLYRQAIKAGATSVLEPSDRNWGEDETLMRGAGVRDPFGNVWWLAGPKPR